MPENTGEVKAFQFDKDSFEEMKDIYKEILDCFGVKDLEARIAKDITPLEEGDRNGLMFNKMVSDLFATPQERKDKASKSI